MPTVDPSRAAFVRKPLRFEVETDNTVLPDYPNAEALEIETNLAQASAAGLALTILNDNNSHALVYEIEIDGALNVDELDGALKTYTFDCTEFDTDGRTLKLIGAEINYANDTTILRVRG